MSAQPAEDNQALDELLSTLRTTLLREHVSRQGVDLNRLARSMARAVPTAEPTNAMVTEVGPYYDTAALTAWLTISRQAIDQRVRARKLLACPSEESMRFYPVWQFQDDGTTNPGLNQVLDILAEGTSNHWTWARWMLGSVPGQLEGKSAAQWLADGGDVETVLALARQDAAAWAA